MRGDNMGISLNDPISVSAWRIMGRAITKVRPLVALVALAPGRSPPSHKVHPTEGDILTARQKAVWLQAEYRRVAPVVLS